MWSSERKEKKATCPGGGWIGVSGVRVRWDDGEGDRDCVWGGGLTSVGEDDVGYGEETLVETCIDCGLNLPVARFLDADPDHGDQQGRDDGDEARDCQEADSFQSAWHGTDHRDDQSDHTKDDRAGAMAYNGVHHDREREDVTTHHEDEEDNLCGSEYFSPNWTSHHFSCVRHIVHPRIGELELSNYESRVCC